MTTATLERANPAARGASLLADLRATQHAAAAMVASLDLGDRRLWQQVDGAVAELTGAVSRLTAAVTGTPPGPTGPTARNVPPVVRVRAFATAQRRLSAALDRNPAPDPELLKLSHRELRAATNLIETAAES